MDSKNVSDVVFGIHLLILLNFEEILKVGLCEILCVTEIF